MKTAKSAASSGLTIETFPEDFPMYDMKNLTKFKTLSELAPDAFKAFVALDEAALKDGAIPAKYKELMAVAVSLTTQCPYCMEVHTKKAKKLGATETELAETTMVAAALRAGAAVTHGTHTLA
jgi:AhpD family alkylhydroperoxidase